MSSNSSGPGAGGRWRRPLWEDAFPRGLHSRTPCGGNKHSESVLEINIQRKGTESEGAGASASGPADTRATDSPSSTLAPDLQGERFWSGLADSPGFREHTCSGPEPPAWQLAAMGGTGRGFAGGCRSERCAVGQGAPASGSSCILGRDLIDPPGMA